MLCVPVLADAPAPAGTGCGDVTLAGLPFDTALLRLGRAAGFSILFQREVVGDALLETAPGGDDCRARLDGLVEARGLAVEDVEPAVLVVRRPRPRASLAERGPSVPLPPDARRVTAAPAARPLEQVSVYGRTVTASRLRGGRHQESAQVDVIDRHDIEQSGMRTVSDLLRFLPAVSGNSTSTYVTNGGDGTASITLRGLPSSNTLVLLNGRRLNADALSGKSVDLNTLPLAAVERIEVLKDGASAIHGSDAIAGVVNVITRSDVRGLHLASYGGLASRGDLETQHHSVLWGTGDTDWSLTVGGEFFDQQGIASSDRAISRTSDDRTRGGIDKRSSATVPARVTLPSGPVILAAGADGDAPGDFRPATEEDRFEYRDFTDAFVPSRRASLFAEGRRDLDPRLSVWFEFLHTETESETRLAPAPLFTGFEVLPLTVAADAAFNPFGVPVEDVRRRLVELPGRRQRNETDSDRVAVGLRWQGDAAEMELFASRQDTDARETWEGLLHGPRLQQALGPAEACAAEPGCAPLNLFGPAGSIGPDALAWVGTEATSQGDTTLETLSLSGSGSLRELPAGRLEVAAGIDWRRESLTVVPDPQARRDELVGGNNFGITEGRRSVTEVYAETLVPLLADLPGIRRLELQVADRYSRYSDFGSTHNPKVTLRWRPVDDLLLRATWGQGFRAPSLRELNLSVQQSAALLVDPCAAEDAVSTLPGCETRADVTLNQFLTLFGGNPDLRPEQARNLTLGFLWTPAFVPGELRLSADVYDIEQENVVDASAQYVVDENAGAGRFPARVERDDRGNLQRVTATNLNIGQRSIEGADLSVVWRAPPGPLGLLELSVNASHIHRFLDQVDPNAPAVDRAGTFQDAASEGNGGLPDWKANLSVALLRGPFEARWDAHHVSALDEEVPLSGRTREIDDWTVHNVQVAWRWVSHIDARLALGVHNVLDTPPPFAASAFNDSFDSRTHDLIGRFVYTRLAARL
jgi:iron complex outermembrane receptor protein